MGQFTPRAHGYRERKVNVTLSEIPVCQKRPPNHVWWHMPVIPVLERWKQDSGVQGQSGIPKIYFKIK